MLYKQWTRLLGHTVLTFGDLLLDELAQRHRNLGLNSPGFPTEHIADFSMPFRGFSVNIYKLAQRDKSNSD